PDLDPVGLHARLRRLAQRLGRARRARLEIPVVEAAALALLETARVACQARARGQHVAGLQPQPHVALLEPPQGGGPGPGGHLVLGYVAVHRRAVFLWAAGLQRPADALEEARHAAIVDRLHGRQAHLLDRLPGGALDRAQHAL